MTKCPASATPQVRQPSDWHLPKEGMHTHNRVYLHRHITDTCIHTCPGTLLMWHVQVCHKRSHKALFVSRNRYTLPSSEHSWSLSWFVSIIQEVTALLLCLTLRSQWDGRFAVSFTGPQHGALFLLPSAAETQTPISLNTDGFSKTFCPFDYHSHSCLSVWSVELFCMLFF